MRLLKKMCNPVELQVLCDALSEQGINYRVDNAGMSALMPLPGVMDARVLVAEEDMQAARLVLSDLGMGAAGDD